MSILITVQRVLDEGGNQDSGMLAMFVNRSFGRNVCRTHTPPCQLASCKAWIMWWHKNHRRRLFVVAIASEAEVRLAYAWCERGFVGAHVFSIYRLLYQTDGWHTAYSTRQMVGRDPLGDEPDEPDED